MSPVRLARGGNVSALGPSPVRVFDGHARMTSVVVEGRTVRVADDMDTRFLLEDLFAKIKATDATRYGDS